MYSYMYKVMFSECDPGGIIYFAAVFDIAHRAYEEFIQSAENMEDYFYHTRIAIPIVNSEANFNFPIKLHENIKINISVEKVQSSSFVLNYEIEGESDTIKAAIKTVHVTIDKSTGQKTNIPVDLKSYLEANCD